MAGSTAVLRAQDAGQQPAKPAMMAKDADPDWEVVTVKPSDLYASGHNIETNGRHVIVNNEPVEMLLGFGYGVQNSQIVANAFAGTGGNIRLQAQRVFLADPTSQVSASSALNIPGTVNIQAPITNLSGALVPLPQAFARATELLSTRCAERLRAGTVSTLVVRGRDGVPARPGGVVPLPLALASPEASEAEGPAGPPEAPAVSRVGALYLDDHGQAQVRGWHGPGVVPAVLALDCAK